jgi:hypothetical protein
MRRRDHRLCRGDPRKLIEFPVGTRTAAAEALRGLIDAIVLTPQEGELKIEPFSPAVLVVSAEQDRLADE